MHNALCFVLLFSRSFVAVRLLSSATVFLKYYHVELLAKLYEEQLRKIVLVQACVRRWLARVNFKRARSTMTQSAMTVQRYVRGWLTRKRLQQMRNDRKQRQMEEQQLREHRKQSIIERESKFAFTLGLLNELSVWQCVAVLVCFFPSFCLKFILFSSFFLSLA